MLSQRARRATGALFLVFALAADSHPVVGQSGASGGEWRYYGGDPGNTRYSTLDQVNRENVRDLRIAWRWKAHNFGPQPDFNYQATPIMIDGVLTPPP